MTTDRSPVVVGYDHSRSADAAQTWALAEARTRKVPLRLIYAFSGARTYAAMSTYGNLAMPEAAALRTAAEGLLTAAVDGMTAAREDVEISTHAYDGDAATVLLTEAQHASTVVLGSRRLGRLSSAVLGSVGTAVSAKAPCPVVVVRGDADLAVENATVVVGVQADENSEDAISYAFEYASRHGLRLNAVLCWHPDVLAEVMMQSDRADPVHAELLLSEALAGWREKYPDVEVHSAISREHPVEALVAASHGQHLLVVGTHGRGAVAGLLLGSVSQGVLHHATCPVAVVPACS